MRGLILTHGGLGGELLKVVQMIMGPVQDLDGMSNHGKSALDLTADAEPGAVAGWDPQCRRSDQQPPVRRRWISVARAGRSAEAAGRAMTALLGRAAASDRGPGARVARRTYHPKHC